MGLVVAGFLLADLFLETQTLVHGIVEFGKGVAHLAAADEQFEAVGDGRVVGVAARQRRNFRGVMVDEVGLNELGLHEDVEELGLHLAELLALEHLFAAFFHQRLGRVEVVVHVRGNAPDGLQGLVERHPGPARAEMDGLALVLHGVAARDAARDVPEKPLGQIHEVVVPGKGPVELAHGEFRVVAGGDALVTEVAPHLVDLFEAAHEQPLEVELRGDAHIKRHVQGIVVRDEGLGRGAAGDGLHHGGFHFHEAGRIQKCAQLAHDLGARLEDLDGLGRDDQVHVALAVARLHVFEAMVLLGKRPHGLGQQLDRGGLQGQLAGLGAEKPAAGAHNVADVELLEGGVGLCAEGVPLGEDLEASRGVLDGEKGHLAEGAQGHDAPGQTVGLVLGGQGGLVEALMVRGHGADDVAFLEVVGIQRDIRVEELDGLGDAVLEDLVQFVTGVEAFEQRPEVFHPLGLDRELVFFFAWRVGAHGFLRCLRGFPVC